MTDDVTVLSSLNSISWMSSAIEKTVIIIIIIGTNFVPVDENPWSLQQSDYF